MAEIKKEARVTTQSLGIGVGGQVIKPQPTVGEELAELMMTGLKAYDTKLKADKKLSDAEEEELKLWEQRAYSDRVTSNQIQEDNEKIRDKSPAEKQAFHSGIQDEMDEMTSQFKSQWGRDKRNSTNDYYNKLVYKHDVANTKVIQKQDLDGRTMSFANQQGLTQLEMDDFLKENNTLANKTGLTSTKQTLYRNVATGIAANIDNMPLEEFDEAQVREERSAFLDGKQVQDAQAIKKIEDAIKRKKAALNTDSGNKDQTITASNSTMNVGTTGSASMAVTIADMYKQKDAYTALHGEPTTSMKNAIADAEMKYAKQVNLEGLVDEIVNSKDQSTNSYFVATAKGQTFKSSGRKVSGMENGTIQTTSEITSEDIDTEISKRIDLADVLLSSNEYNAEGKVVLDGIVKLEQSNSKFKSTYIDSLNTSVATGIVHGTSDEMMKTLNIVHDYNAQHGNNNVSWVKEDNLKIIQAQRDRLMAEFSGEGSDGGETITPSEERHMSQRLSNTIYGVSNRASSNKTKSDSAKAFMFELNKEIRENDGKKLGAADAFVTGYVAGDAQFAEGAVHILSQMYGNRTIGYNSLGIIETVQESTMVMEASDLFPDFMEDRMVIVKPNQHVTQKTMMNTLTSTIKAEMGEKYTDMDKHSKFILEQYPNSKGDIITHAIIRGGGNRILYSRQFLPNELAYGTAAKYTK